jgi:hypothetical protein
VFNNFLREAQENPGVFLPYPTRLSVFLEQCGVPWSAAVFGNGVGLNWRASGIRDDSMDGQVKCKSTGSETTVVGSCVGHDFSHHLVGLWKIYPLVN